MIPNYQYKRCEICPSRASRCTLDPTSTFAIATDCVEGYKLVDKSCVSAKECPAGNYVSYFDETCITCPTGMENCYYDYNRWKIVATSCITNFVLDDDQNCIVNNKDLFYCTKSDTYPYFSAQGEVSCKACPVGASSCYFDYRFNMPRSTSCKNE